MVMKRRRKAKRCLAQPHNNDETILISETSIHDLPSTIAVEIFLKLPTKSIVMCKSTCKTWRALISDREFARIHSAIAKECTLIRDANEFRFSRSFYLLEDDDHLSGYCRCRARKKEKCKNCRVSTTVNARLKVPLRNAQDLLCRLSDGNIGDTMFCIGSTSKSKSKSKSKNVVNLESARENLDEVVNSCNGLLCLYQSEWFRLYFGHIITDIRDPMVVCNPVTGEFMHLPDSDEANENTVVVIKAFGFGYSPKHGEYKVIRVFPGSGYDVAEIHTLGTKSWRKIDLWATYVGSFRHQTYLDGALHWLSHGQNERENEFDSMVSFDLNEEKFQIHSLPCRVYERPELAGSGLRVSGGRLHLLDASTRTHVHIWVMNENGNHEYWTKLFSVDISELKLSVDWSSIQPKYFQLLYVKKEAVVMFYHHGDEFIYYDRLEAPRFKRLRLRGCGCFKLQAIAYTPSFISLKDIVGPGNAEVLNINSRCGKLKLLEETNPFLLGGPRRVV